MRGFLTLSIFIYSLLSGNIHAQTFLTVPDTLDNMDMEQVKTYLTGELRLLDSIIGFADTRYEIAPAKEISNNKENFSSKKFYSVYSEKELREGMEKYMEKLEFSDYRKYPETYIGINTDEKYLNELLPGYKFMKIHEGVKELFFWDRTSAKVNDTITPRNVPAFNTMKVIDSIRANISLYYPTDMKRIVLDPQNNEYKIDNSTIRLTRLEGKSATVYMDGLYAGEWFSGYIFEVEPLSSEGKKIGITNSPSDGIHDVLLLESTCKIKPDLVRILSEIDSRKLKTNQEVKCELEGITKKYEKEIAFGDIDSVSYTFSDDVESISIVLYSRLDKVSQEKTVHNINLNYYSRYNYSTVKAGKDERVGIMDNTGNWIIEPRFKWLNNETALYYKRQQVGKKDNDSKYYRLDLEKKELIPTDFTWMRPLLEVVNKYTASTHNFKELYRLSQAATDEDLLEVMLPSEKRGIIDQKGNYIIPPKYSSITSYPEDGFFLASYHIKDVGYRTDLYNREGNRVYLFPEEHYVRDIKAGIFYGDFGKNYGQDQFVLNTDKKQILQPGWTCHYNNRSAGRFSDGLLHIMHIEDRSISSFYIDMEGNVVLPYRPDLRYISSMINGMAIVEDTESRKVGFINKEGEPVIKPNYEYAEPFFTDVAYIETSRDAFFIDKNDKIITHLPSKKINSWIDPKKSIDEIRYEFMFGIKYDVYGRLCSDD